MPAFGVMGSDEDLGPARDYISRRFPVSKMA